MIRPSIILLWLLHLPLPCQCEFLAQPSLRWTYRVPDSGTLAGRGFRSGNEIAVSPDGTTLFATADDGSLHFVTLSDLRKSYVFEPEPIAGTFTECRSGVTMMYDDDNALAYLVYAVMDVPFQVGILYEGISVDASRTTTISRLLAVNLDGTLKWTLPLSGTVVGKLVAAAKNDNKLYVVHNIPNYIGSSPARGKVSVVLLQPDNSQPTITASIAPFDSQGPFGPPTGVTLIDGTPVLVVAEAWDDGYALDNGRVFLVKPSSLYNEFGGQGDEAYELALISDWAAGSVTRPAIVVDDQELQVFCGGAAARLSGWSSLKNVVAGSQQNVTPTWNLSLTPNRGNASHPLLVSPILSGDQTVLYQAGASTEMYAVDTIKGGVIWTSTGIAGGSVYAEPKLVELLPNSPKVYVIEGLNGKVRQHDALTGTIDWTFDCRNVSGIACDDAVEADFSVAPSGNTLYYGDIFGKIVALDIAAFSTSPTPAVTVQPETASPLPLEVISDVETTPVTTPKVTSVPTTTAIESEKPDKTATPTWGPLEGPTPATQTGKPTQAPIPQDVTIPNGDGGTEGVGFDDVEPTVVQEPDTEFSTSAAVNENEKANDSFFSNEIMIVLVAVCGGLTLAILVLLFAQRMRNSKRSNKRARTDHELIGDDQDGKDWNSAQDEYEEACRRNEEETLREIVSLAPKTPSKKGKFSKKQSKKLKKPSPVTPSTLASIEESPAECEVSFVSDATPNPKNLEKSFDASMVEVKHQSQEVSLTDAPLPEKPLTKNVEAASRPTAEILPVEEVAKNDVGKPPSMPASRVKSPDSARVKSPESPTESNDCADITSVDGSLYFDDDSYVQGSKVEVASLSQFSAASSRDGASDIGTNYTFEGQVRYEAADSNSPGDTITQPPTVSSPLLRPLSPAVAEYLRRNQSSLSPSPHTPGGFMQPGRTETMSPSPVTPPSDEGGDSPAERAPDETTCRAGQSVQTGGPPSGEKQGRGPQKASETKEMDRSGSGSPSMPRPPVEADRNDEPEDAWDSFLSELAKAEREFFNPSFSKSKNKKQGRPQSPPPPPPDSPPTSPRRSADPPVRGG